MLIKQQLQTAEQYTFAIIPLLSLSFWVHSRCPIRFPALFRRIDLYILSNMKLDYSYVKTSKEMYVDKAAEDENGALMWKQISYYKSNFM